MAQFNSLRLNYQHRLIVLNEEPDVIDNRNRKEKFRSPR